MSRISVIIPAYNSERFIGAALESVFAQTRLPDEVVVVDDACTDGTPRVLEAWQDRVQVLRNRKNSGPGHSRNRGIEQTTGDLLLFLDADDMMLPQHIEITEKLFDRWPEAGMVISGVHKVEEDGQTILKTVLCERCVDQPQDMFPDFMYGVNVYTGNQSFRREAVLEVGGYREIPMRYRGRRVQCEDNDLARRVAVNKMCVANSVATILYRTHQSQATMVPFVQNVILAFEYRLRLVCELRMSSEKNDRFHIGKDRMLRKWELDLRDKWINRQIYDLRVMTSWGLKNQMFRSASLYYLPRALFGFFQCRK